MINIAGRGERIRTSGLYVPNVALYRTKLRPDCDVNYTRFPCDEQLWRHRAHQGGAGVAATLYNRQTSMREKG